jgi:hypothetical protein
MLVEGGRRVGGGTRGHTLVIILKQSPGPTPTSNDALMHVARSPSSIRGERLENHLIILNFISIIYSKHVRRKSRRCDRIAHISPREKLRNCILRKNCGVVSVDGHEVIWLTQQ